MTTDKTSCPKSKYIIVWLVLFLKNTICMTAGNVNVVSTSVKFPISPTTVPNAGISSAISDIRHTSTVRSRIYFGVLMKIFPCSMSSPSTVSFTGSIHSGNPPTTVTIIARLMITPSAPSVGNEFRMLSCTPGKQGNGEPTDGLVVLRENDADEAVEHGHQRNGDRRRANHVTTAVATDVFLDWRNGETGTYWVRRKRMKPMQ